MSDRGRDNRKPKVRQSERQFLAQMRNETEFNDSRVKTRRYSHDEVRMAHWEAGLNVPTSATLLSQPFRLTQGLGQVKKLVLGL